MAEATSQRKCVCGMEKFHSDDENVDVDGRIFPLMDSKVLKAIECQRDCSAIGAVCVSVSDVE